MWSIKIYCWFLKVGVHSQSFPKEHKMMFSHPLYWSWKPDAWMLSPLCYGSAAVVLLPLPSCCCFSFSFSPSTLNSLFRSPALSGAGDLSTNVNLKSRSGNGSGEKTFRPQTFLSPVAMATVPPALQLPQAAVGKAAPPFSCSSAASMRPLQQAPHAETPDKSAKRAFVPPMTPQPLHIQGSAQHWHTHCLSNNTHNDKYFH